jgi:hypothetical protein
MLTSGPVVLQEKKNFFGSSKETVAIPGQSYRNTPETILEILLLAIMAASVALTVAQSKRKLRQ